MGTVAKTKLKRMDRFELLELLYNMRKANVDLTERLEAAEQKIQALEKEADARAEAVRAEYVQRIDELRMQGAASELQKRMKEIEEQLTAFQRITGMETASGNQDTGRKEEDMAGVSAPPEPDAQPTAENTASPQESGAASGTPDREAGESRE